MTENHYIRFIVYSDDSGEILRTGRCPPRDLPLQGGDGLSVMEGLASDVDHYVAGGEVLERPKISCHHQYEVGIGEPVLISCPSGTRVRISPSFDEISHDGDIDISFPVAGVYWADISNFPYREEVIKIEVSI